MNADSNHVALAKCLDEFDRMLPQLSAVREGIDLYGATQFSAFSIFNPDENRLSRVIAELFDPAGSHGQGLLFLNGLLSAIGIPRLNRLDAVKVRREALTRAKRRIDIVIETKRYVIGIENKPWAAQQKNQLGDYLAELQADLRGRKPVLVFLSDQIAQSANESTICVPYIDADRDRPSLHKIFDGLSGDIKANAPKSFVVDFLRYIEIRFGGKYVENAADKPFLDAVSAEFDDPQRRKAIACILLSQEALHCRILDEIGDYLHNEVQTKVGNDFEVSCPTHGYEPRVSECLWAKWVPFGLRRPAWPANCHVALESHKGVVREIFFGVRCPDVRNLSGQDKNSASPVRKTLDKLISGVPGGQKSRDWPWWKPLNVDWRQEYCARLVLESPTGAVKDHPEIQDLAQQFVELAREVDRLFAVKAPDPGS
jgi:hypothetical protein